MREAIGGTWLFNLVIFFVLLFAGYMCLSINYSKAFNVKDKIINEIERNGGILNFSNSEIKFFAKIFSVSSKIFLLIPTAYNYKNNYSKIRFSKFATIIILGLFNSYVLKSIVIGGMSYTDASIKYNDSIFVIKNIVKGLIYFGYVLLALRDIKLYKAIKNYINNKKNVD